MPKNHNESVVFEAVKWLYDIGCDEPLNTDKRSFHGLISSIEKINDKKTYSEFTEHLNFEKIDSIKSLEEYLLSKNIILDSSIPFYDGFDKADLMVIGDKPESLTNKKPFQGEERKLLDAMLKAISFDKTNTYYANLHFASIKLDINLLLKIIKKQISIVEPKIIIMLGAEVTKILSNTEDSIFHSRGKWYDINIEDNLEPILGISMFHPRYILVNNESKKETWEDLKDIRKKFT